MADIKIVDQQGTEVIHGKEVSTPDVVIIPDGVMMTERIAQIFDLKPSEVSRYERPLNDLIEYAKMKTDDHSAEGLKWAIRSLGTKLGTPPLGEKLVTYLQRYARLYMESKKIEAEKDKFLRGEKDDDN